MAAIISISSDEEVDEPVENPRKKLKLIKVDSVICLDDEEEKNPDVNKITDVLVESDEDMCFKDAGNNNKQTDSNSSNFQSDNQDSEETTEICDKDKVIEASKSNIDKNKALEEAEGENIIKMFKNSKEMQIFINLCLSQITTESTRSLFESKILLCKKLFDKVSTEYIQSEGFTTFLNEKIELSKKSSIIAITSFNDIYLNLKVQVNSEKTNNETTNSHEKIISKLEHTFRKIQKIIAKLEEAEVNFDEEEDSSYIKLQRYRERAVKIHEKICKYKKEDAHADHILYTRLNFSASSFPEINQAINKKFKNNSVFPTYYDVERCIRKAVKDKNMNLSDSRLKEESRECFTNLGNLLQKRRKVDLLNTHSQYLTLNNDPASEDQELELKLKTNYKEATSKINEICEKYTKLQERGEEPALSSDSDDSNRPSSEDEDVND